MLIKNQTGAALPLTLIVMMVLGMFGAVLMTISVSETRQVAIDENNLKAHYLARSGAHTVATYLIRNPEQIDDYLNHESGEVELVDGTFQVKVYGDLNNTYVESIGRTGGAESKVILTITRAADFDFALYGEDVNLGGNMKVFGDVVYGENENVSDGVVQDGYALIHDPDTLYPDASFPNCSDLAYKDDIDMGGQYTSETVDQDTCTGLVSMNNKHHDLTIKLGDAENPKDLIILTDEFNVNGGNIKLEGHGRLLLYVKDKFVLGGNYETVEPGNAHTVVFIKDGAEFTQSGTSNFEGLIYAPSVDFQTTGGGNASNIIGSVVTRSIVGSGNVEVIYKEFDNTGLPLNLYRLGKWRYDL